MQIINDVTSVQQNLPSVVTIGTFDGVHKGHRKILERLVTEANDRNFLAVVFTFFPHPKSIVSPAEAPKQIHSLTEKIECLKKLGVQQLVLQPFTENFAKLSAEEFVYEILVKRLHTKKIIVGYDHRFGKNRSASIVDLKIFGEKFGFEVEEISPQEINETAVSSTKIRNALKEGNIPVANAYLQADFSLEGIVIHGQKLGKKINFPTANIHIEEAYKLLPKKGAYAVYSFFEGKKVFGMLNLGSNPTIQGKGFSVEVHFFDFNANLYGKKIKVFLLEFLREEQKFPNIEALKKQLEADENRVRKSYLIEK